MDSDKACSMEFGDFANLPASDKDFVNKILFSAESLCKDGKRPEFSWMSNDKAHDEENLGSISGRENIQMHPDPSCKSQNALPDQVDTTILSNDTPIVNNTVQSVQNGLNVTMQTPLLMQSVPIMSPYFHQVTYVPYPHVAYPIPFYPTSAVPGLTPMPPHMYTEHLANHNRQSFHMDNNDNQIDIDNSQKSLPRRNKKKRPPGYYDDLSVRERSQYDLEEHSPTGDHTVLNVHPDMKHVIPEHAIYFDNRLGADSNVNSNLTTHHDVSYNHYSPNHSVNAPGSKPDTAAISNYVAEQHTYNVNKLKTIQVEERNSSHLETNVSNENANCYMKSDLNSGSTENCAVNCVELNPANRNEEHLELSFEFEGNAVIEMPDVASPCLDPVVEETQLSPVLNNMDVNSEIAPVSLEQANVVNNCDDKQSEEITVCDDVSPVQSITTDINNHNNEPFTDLREPPVAAAQNKKPSSWAGLFSCTKPAQSASVVYSESTSSERADNSANNTRQSSIASLPSSHEAPLKLLTAKNDDAAVTIAKRIIEHGLNHKPLALIPRGLTNRKNWCYVNATLQALLACPPLYHLLIALPNYPEKRRKRTSCPFTDALVRFVHEFSSWHDRLPEKKGFINGKGTVKLDIPTHATFEPTYVYNVLRLEKYASHFIYGRQEDAEEFLGCLLNALHEEMAACLALVNPPQPEEEAKQEPNGKVEESSTSETVIEEDGWEQVGPKNKAVITRATKSSISPISQVFQGQIRSTLQQHGSRESATLQPFFTLQLDIQSEKVLSVKDALEYLVKKESLNDYTCTKTKQEIEASRRIVLEELPPVLVLHLKYFVYDKSGGSQKLTKHIEFSENLDISKDFLSPNIKSKLTPGQRKYKLFAVVNHHGARLLGGHYTTYVYHLALNSWIHIDDEMVRSVKVESMLRHNPPRVPYLLYYRKVEQH